MWNPTTNTTAISSSETSDNNKHNKENREEDCRCGGSGTTQQIDLERDITSNSGSVVSIHNTKQQQQQEQQLDNLEINSNSKLQQTSAALSTTSFGGNLSKSDSNSFEDTENFNNKTEEEELIKNNKKEIELIGGYSESVDSGFISGPQNQTNQFNDNNEKILLEQSEQNNQTSLEQQEGAIGGVVGSSTLSNTSTNLTKYNILPNEGRIHQQRKKEETAAVLDSGCIEEEEEEEENFDDYNEEQYEDENEDDQQQQKQEKANVKPLGCSSIQNNDLDKQNISEQEEQIKSSAATALDNNSKSNTNTYTIAAANTTFANNNTTSASTTTTQEANPMIFKQNVDAGMSEWFCNLNLQSDSQSSTAINNGMNNLDVNNERKANTSALPMPKSTTHQSQQTQTQTQSQAHPQQPAAASMNPGPELTPTAAWEQFFQQNDDGDTPLHLAVICGRIDVIVALLRTAPHPCLLNIQNDDAQTPLHLAALTSRPSIIRMLLLAGAEPKARDRDGNTALHLACMNGEIQCVRSLLENFNACEIVEAHRQFGHLSNDKTISSLNFARLPSDLEIRNYNGERCVHLVAQNGNIDILRLLVLHGADINAREGRSGLTPLHIAIECCNEKLANFLLDECEKLNVETATYAGLTAYQVACMLNKSQLQTMLENYGAEPLTPPDSDYDSSDIEELDELYERFGDPGFFIGYSGGNPMTVA